MVYTPPAQDFVDNISPIAGGQGPPLNAAFFNALVDGVVEIQGRVGVLEAAPGGGGTGRAPVRVASTTALTLSGLQVVDGISILAGDRVLARNAAAQSPEVGIYLAAGGAWTRATDWAAGASIARGTTVDVAQGTVNGRKTFFLDSASATVVVGTTSANFSETAGLAVLDEGVVQSVRPRLNFVGDLVDVENDLFGAGEHTVVIDSSLLPGLGGSSSGTKDPVRVASVGGLTLSGLQTVDGVSLQSGNRVLYLSGLTPSQRGIYNVASGAWTRAADFDQNADAVPGVLIPVLEGTANGGVVYRLATPGPITLGTTSLTFEPIGSVTQVEDEGSALLRRRILNFVGAGVTVADDSANNRTVVTIPGGGGGGGGQHIIVDETTPLTQRASLRFTGNGVDVTDSAANNWSSVSISGVSVQRFGQEFSSDFEILPYRPTIRFRGRAGRIVDSPSFSVTDVYLDTSAYQAPVQNGPYITLPMEGDYAYTLDSGSRIIRLDEVPPFHRSTVHLALAQPPAGGVNVEWMSGIVWREGAAPVLSNNPGNTITFLRFTYMGSAYGWYGEVTDEIPPLTTPLPTTVAGQQVRLGGIVMRGTPASLVTNILTDFVTFIPDSLRQTFATLAGPGNGFQIAGGRAGDTLAGREGRNVVTAEAFYRSAVNSMIFGSTFGANTRAQTVCHEFGHMVDEEYYRNGVNPGGGTIFVVSNHPTAISLHNTIVGDPQGVSSYYTGQRIEWFAQSVGAFYKADNPMSLEANGTQARVDAFNSFYTSLNVV